MLSINITRKDEYKPGDLGFTTQEDSTPWLVEVLKVHSWGYESRLTRMQLSKETGRHSVDCNSSGTYGSVPKEKMQRFRLENIDFESVAGWQRFVDTNRDKK
jgi:hypothetical protein